jgi:hypothetical protein
MSKPQDTNEASGGRSDSTAVLGMVRVGWWVVFDEPNDVGQIPFGFFISDERARTFDKEPGFLRNHLEPVYRRGPNR